MDTNSTQKYVFSSTAYWLNGGYGPYVIFWAFTRLKHKSAARALPMTESESAVGPHDQFAPGTQPTGSFGWTSQRQLAVGLGIGLTIFIIGIVAEAMVSN